MLNLSNEIPDEAFHLALGRLADAPLSNRRGRIGLAREGIPIHVPDAFEASALDPDRFERQGWRFLVYGGDALLAAVVIREEKGDLRTAGIEVADLGDASWTASLDAAIQIADEREEAYELRTLEVPWLHVAFAWLSGPRPVFVDKVTAEQLDDEGFRERLRRLWTDRFGDLPEPTAEPRLR